MPSACSHQPCCPVQTRSAACCRRGTATIEFALVFPILLVMTLVVLQFMLLMTGRLYVQYAAFAAVRTAIVQVPRDMSEQGGEIHNQIVNASGDPKFDLIHQAAAMALVPTAGRSESDNAPQGNLDTDLLIEAMSSFYASQGQTAPNWVENMLAEKINYALEFTSVDLVDYTTLEDDFFQSLQDVPIIYEPQDSVSVRVEHELALSVPYIRTLFEDGENEVGPYTLVTSVATLTNEGVYPLLPEAPTPPRDPQ